MPDRGAAATQGIDLIREGIALLAGEDRSQWSGSARAAVVLEISEACERLEAERVRAVGDWDADKAWVADGALSASSWLAANAAVSRARANQVVRTARLAGRYERVGKALAAGDLSTPQAEVMATATRGRDLLLRRDEDLLVDIAPTLSVDDYTTVMKHWRSAADDEMARADAQLAFVERSVSWATTLYERVDLQMNLDADAGATVIGALQAHDTGPDPKPEEGGPADGPRTLAQRHADAMVQICAEALERRQAAGHPTPGENCVLLCRRHHVLCYEGGWRLVRSPDGTMEIAERGPDPRTRPPRPPGAGPSARPSSRASARHRAPPYGLAA